MTHLLALPLALALALPVAAQDVVPPPNDAPGLMDRRLMERGVMERGLRQFMDGLLREMEPALRDLEGLAQDAAPLLEELQRNLDETLGDLNAYRAPEVLPNGDILIRRREPLDPGLPVRPSPDRSIDL